MFDSLTTNKIKNEITKIDKILGILTSLNIKTDIIKYTFKLLVELRSCYEFEIKVRNGQNNIKNFPIRKKSIFRIVLAREHINYYHSYKYTNLSNYLEWYTISEISDYLSTLWDLYIDEIKRRKLK